jgi:hypothetical protein
MYLRRPFGLSTARRSVLNQGTGNSCPLIHSRRARVCIGLLIVRRRLLPAPNAVGLRTVV